MSLRVAVRLLVNPSLTNRTTSSSPGSTNPDPLPAACAHHFRTGRTRSPPQPITQHPPVARHQRKRASTTRIGAHLARIELAEALTTMARRMPNMRCSGPVPWKPLTGITGPISLQVEFASGY